MICIYDEDYAIQSTKSDIIEQGEIPFLQMRNLRFRFISKLDIKNMTLKMVGRTPLILDLLDGRSYIWNAKFEKYKKIYFFPDFKHFDMAIIRRKKSLLWMMRNHK